MPPGYLPDDYNASVPFNPIATNGEPFPWHKLQLPDSIRPVRYTLTIHPNMTSIDVKGKSGQSDVYVCDLNVCAIYVCPMCVASYFL